MRESVALLGEVVADGQARLTATDDDHLLVVGGSARAVGGHEVTSKLDKGAALAALGLDYEPSVDPTLGETCAASLEAQRDSRWC